MEEGEKAQATMDLRHSLVFVGAFPLATAVVFGVAYVFGILPADWDAAFWYIVLTFPTSFIEALVLNIESACLGAGAIDPKCQFWVFFVEGLVNSTLWGAAIFAVRRKRTRDNLMKDFR